MSADVYRNAEVRGLRAERDRLVEKVTEARAEAQSSAREVERQRQEMARLQARIADLERERDEWMSRSTPRVVLPAQDFDRIEAEVEQGPRASPALQALAKRYARPSFVCRCAEFPGGYCPHHGTPP